uniref:Protein kinase domain-containing protein n=2 Tax=Kalanchoe fedtschenkoi TaxID=63787 RepID=A0A7N0VK30_KALFE
MAAALECWARRSSNDEVEQVLMGGNDRSEGVMESTMSSTGARDASSSVMQKKLQRLGRNVSEAIASLKNSLNLDSSGRDGPLFQSKIENCRKAVWDNVVRNLSQPFPGNRHLPEKLASSIRKHYDSFPNSYSQAGFEMKDVLLHMRLLEQASDSAHPSVHIQDLSTDEVSGSVFKLTFACNSSISWSSMSAALDSSVISCKKLQIYEKKGCTLGVVHFVVQAGNEKVLKARVESALKTAVKKQKSASVKLPFGLCGCQQEDATSREQGDVEEDPIEQMNKNGAEKVPLPLQMPLPDSCYRACVDEWQTVCSGREELGKWLLSPDGLEFGDQIGSNSFRGVFRGKRVGIEKLKGCDKGNSFEFELRRDLLELMTCGHKNISQFYGVCIDEYHGLCVLTKLMECGSLMDHMLKKKKFQTKEVLRIMTDVAEGLRFMNDHGVAYKDLNTQRIMLDRHGNACLGDMGIVSACKGAEGLEYETDGYRWLAPEIIAGDPETVTETWMSNVYSFGMVMWEMVTGEAAYSVLSPVQAAVGIAACGLRPEIPKDCPPNLKSLMTKCWNSSPTKRPQFAEIISVLLRPTSTTRHESEQGQSLNQM